MKWRWCDMCRFDGHCENQDRNMECACYAREQTLRAEQYSNLVDKVETENTKLKTDCRTLAQKLLQVKPELREWLEVNYKEYL